jgi:hypothetical protein
MKNNTKKESIEFEEEKGEQWAENRKPLHAAVEERALNQTQKFDASNTDLKGENMSEGELEMMGCPEEENYSKSGGFISAHNSSKGSIN